MGPFFDLHIHPSFKPFLSHIDERRKDNAWTEYRHPLGIVRSQGSLPQIQEGRVHIAVNPIYTLEKIFSSSFLTRHLVPKLTMMDEEMVNTAASVSYFDRLKEEVAFLKRFANHNPDAGRTFNMVNSAHDIDEDKINIVLAIEGGHSLEKTNYRLAESLRELKAGPDRFLYLTLMHMTQFPLSAHAYGMKLMKHNDILKPKNCGLADVGRELIDEAYRETDAEPRVFIDVKHLSLLARRQFYHYRREKGYEQVPILATHMGVTGISYHPDVIKRYITEKEVKKDRGFVQVTYERPEGIGADSNRDRFKTHFNPWSINLYNEEIVEILDSGGLIGLNLDQRIQGADKVKGEFFCEEEFKMMMENRIHMKDDDDFEEEETHFEEEEVTDRGLLRFKERQHLRHFCNNILHIVRQGGERAWKHLCIGSDFDGLINPINTCINCSEYGKLEEMMAEELGEMIEEAKAGDPQAEFYEDDLKLRARDIMYHNGHEFLKRHFV